MQTTGPFSEREVSAFLEQAVLPVRLACNAAPGQPLVLSLWFVPEAGALYCASLRSARVVRCLERDPRCAFEVAGDQPPYRGVRGRGTARIEPARGEEILRRALRRYLGGEDAPLARWLLSRSAREVAIRVEPERVASFDYTQRMTASTTRSA